MILIDRIGISANQLDKCLLNLLKDVEVVEFEDCYHTDKDLRKSIAVGNEVPLSTIFRLVEEKGLSFLIQKKHEYFWYNLIMSAMSCKYLDVFLKSPITVITCNANQG